MKKIALRLYVIMQMLTLIFSLTSCGCEHNWKEATCQSAKTCTLCGASEGGISGHSWIEATCIAPKTCDVCGKTEGSASSVHNYSGDACTVCGIIQLTLYNYEDYIDCSATVKIGDYLYYHSIEDYVNTSAECSFKATGNTHYKYDNVYIKIKFSHYDREGYLQYVTNNLNIACGMPIEKEAIPYSERTYTVSLSIAGNGSKTCELTVPWSSEPRVYCDTDALFDRTTYEVISISGTVKEY